jgi:lipopolysaccharide transport protein LptA
VHTSFLDRLSAENERPINVQARAMAYAEADSRITYKGAVEFRREDFVTRTPDALIMELDQSGALSKVTAQGDEVEIVHHDRTAQGRKAVYSPQENTLVIRGDPVVLRDLDKESRGPSLTLDLETDRFVMDGLNEQRTGLRIPRAAPKPSPREIP